MFELRGRAVALPLIGATLLGGCTTYTPPPSSYAYFAVPCDTPGAIRAVPIPPVVASAASSTADPPTSAPPQRADTAVPNGSAQADAVQCLIAVVDRGRGLRGPGYYRGGYPYPYAYPYGYRSPIYGSLGIGIGIGGHHYRGGHFGGDHFGGGHGGRHGSGHH